MQKTSITSLSTEEKIGQLFIVGIPTDRIDAQTSSLIADVRPGGFCLFARNIKEAGQTRELLDHLRELSSVEPILSIDQEGGLVDRLKRLLVPMPSAARLTSTELIVMQAAIIAEALRTLGFNMDFAPVVDVVDESRSRFTNGLHARAYGSSAAEVIELASSFLETIQANGIVGCIKHFPGLGAAEVDSHEELPTVRLSEDEFERVDLDPYRHLMLGGSVHAVMVAHAAYPNLSLQETDQDGTLLPASLSFNFVTKLLRHELGFNGLVVTDDLEMGAIMKNYGIGDAALMAIKAGHDMLAICAGMDSIRHAHESISAAVADGRLDIGSLDTAVERVMELKSRLSPPNAFEIDRLASLSQRIEELKGSLS